MTSIYPTLNRSYTLLASKGFGLMPGQALEENTIKIGIFKNKMQHYNTLLETNMKVNIQN